MGTEAEILDYSTGLLLRFFGSTVKANVQDPQILIDRDREILRLHWSLSPSVQSLISYVLDNRHEVQAVLSSALRHEDGVVRGRLDAVATIRARATTGLSTVVVSREPVRTYDSAPNTVLGWVISEAWSLATRFATLVAEKEVYRETVAAAMQRLEQVRRLSAISTMLAGSAARKRPSGNAVTEAARSRRQLYQKAAHAYWQLVRLEEGDPTTIAETLRSTLLVPMEPWRRYELLVALSVATALADNTGEPAVLSLNFGSGQSVVATVGSFEIAWQTTTKLYAPPSPEPSEVWRKLVLSNLSISSASDRPDLVISDNRDGTVKAIVEVKYLTGESASDRVRSAVDQLVRYARGYEPIASLGSLLERSLIAVSQGLGPAGAMVEFIPSTPAVVDFEYIRQQGLGAWAGRLKL